MWSARRRRRGGGAGQEGNLGAGEAADEAELRPGVVRLVPETILQYRAEVNKREKSAARLAQYRDARTVGNVTGGIAEVAWTLGWRPSGWDHRMEERLRDNAGLSPVSVEEPAVVEAREPFDPSQRHRLAAMRDGI